MQHDIPILILPVRSPAEFRGIARRVYAACLVAVLMGSAAVAASVQEGRLYGGKPITYWQEYVKTNSLADLGEPETVDSLIEIVSDTGLNWSQRRQMALMLGRIGPRAKAVVPVFVRFLNSDEADKIHSRLWALRGLALLGTVAEAATPDVARIANDDSLPFYVRATALETLASVGANRPESVEVLLKALQTDSRSTVDADRIRMIAAESLSLQGANAAAAIPELVRALESHNVLLQRAAATCLGNIGPSAEVAASGLVDLLLFSNGLEACEAAADALAKIGPDGVRSLSRLMKDTDANVRRLGVRGLSKAPQSSVTETGLLAGLMDSMPIIRVESAEPLLQFPSSRPKAVNALCDGLASSDRNTRLAAYRALQRHSDVVEILRPRLRDVSQDASLSNQSREAAMKLLGND
ncbi:HEAT repeat domain-containing protein [Planctomicrobium sp. SH527]|uniref:HEAT repeat domain-containing protein n=1 Tax=Planctomicrobium sp. SH527 TaxID=3448123 RepID=UPI003F5BD82D